MDRGVRFGRKPKLSSFRIAEALRRREAGELLADIGRSYGVSHSTISRSIALYCPTSKMMVVTWPTTQLAGHFFGCGGREGSGSLSTPTKWGKIHSWGAAASAFRKVSCGLHLDELSWPFKDANRRN
jgi:hypothetical protein